MATPDRDSLADGLVSIGEDAMAKSNGALLDEYYTDDPASRLLEEWVQTDTYEFLRQLSAVAR